jgi:hypothetical protein
MRHARKVLAVALVATALCADRAVSANPGLRPTTVERAKSGIVQRLTARLGRAVQRMAMVEARREESASISSSISIAQPVRTCASSTAQLVPAQLPLPPPGA